MTPPTVDGFVGEQQEAVSAKPVTSSSANVTDCTSTSHSSTMTDSVTRIVVELAEPEGDASSSDSDVDVSDLYVDRSSSWMALSSSKSTMTSSASVTATDDDTFQEYEDDLLKNYAIDDDDDQMRIFLSAPPRPSETEATKLSNNHSSTAYPISSKVSTSSHRDRPRWDPRWSNEDDEDFRREFEFYAAATVPAKTTRSSLYHRSTTIPHSSSSSLSSSSTTFSLKSFLSPEIDEWSSSESSFVHSQDGKSRQHSIEDDDKLIPTQSGNDRETSASRSPTSPTAVDDIAYVAADAETPSTTARISSSMTTSASRELLSRRTFEGPVTASTYAAVAAVAAAVEATTKTTVEMTATVAGRGDSTGAPVVVAIVTRPRMISSGPETFNVDAASKSNFVAGSTTTTKRYAVGDNDGAGARYSTRGRPQTPESAAAVRRATNLGAVTGIVVVVFLFVLVALGVVMYRCRHRLAAASGGGIGGGGGARSCSASRRESTVDNNNRTTSGLNNQRQPQPPTSLPTHAIRPSWSGTVAAAAAAVQTSDDGSTMADKNGGGGGSGGGGSTKNIVEWYV